MKQILAEDRLPVEVFDVQLITFGEEIWFYIDLINLRVPDRTIDSKNFQKLLHDSQGRIVQE